MRAPLIGALAAALTLATVGAHAMGQAPDERYTVHLPAAPKPLLVLKKKTGSVAICPCR